MIAFDDRHGHRCLSDNQFPLAPPLMASCSICFPFFPCTHQNLHKLSPLYLLYTFLLNQITRTIMIMNALHTLGYVVESQPSSHLFWYLFNKIINYVMTVWLFVDSFNASIQVYAMRAFHTRYLVSNRFESITLIWFICVDSILANTFCPRPISLWIDQCPLFIPKYAVFIRLIHGTREVFFWLSRRELS